MLRRSSRWCGWRAKWARTSLKADPTADPEDFHRVVETARVPVLVRGGGKEGISKKNRCLQKIRRADGAGCPKGMVYGRNIYQHDNPKAVVNALMAHDPSRRFG